MKKQMLSLAVLVGLMSVSYPLTLAQPGTASVQSSIKIPNGTPVVLRLANEISSKTAMTGTQVDFRVVGDVKVNNTVVIKDGTIGHAQVASADKSGFIGSEGSIAISDFSVNAVDGARVPLAANLSQRGKDRQVLSIALGAFVCLPFFFLKGQDAIIPAGTEKTVYTASDVTVNPAP